jgi:hypothetical protein
MPRVYRPWIFNHSEDTGTFTGDSPHFPGRYNSCRRYADYNSAFELRLASRMSRLGTETAFEVLNRARALEKQGKEIIHLEIGEPDFDTPV